MSYYHKIPLITETSKKKKPLPELLDFHRSADRYSPIPTIVPEYKK